MKNLTYILSVLALTLCFSKASFSAEHPGEAAEHPGSEHPGAGAEHPGHKDMLSSLEIINGIKNHIASVTKANNGYFPITDAEEGKYLKLTLIRVHEDKVSYIKKEDAYFACTDFVTEDGKAKYDVDFWMKKTKEGTLEVYQTKIHKKDGSPRFTYKDDEIVTVDTILEKKGSDTIEKKGSGATEKKGSGY